MDELHFHLMWFYFKQKRRVLLYFLFSSFNISFRYHAPSFLTYCTLISASVHALYIEDTMQDTVDILIV